MVSGKPWTQEEATALCTALNAVAVKASKSPAQALGRTIDKYIKENAPQLVDALPP
jgi:hypothetical protein